MNYTKKTGYIWVLACFILCMTSVAHAEAPICFVKGGTAVTAPTGTPCTTAKAAYDGAKSLIDFNDGCTGSKTVDILFQQEPTGGTTISGYQAAMAFTAAQFSDPVCTPDPAAYFFDALGSDCPGTHAQSGATYVFAGEGNITGDGAYPSSNPNVVMLRVAFTSHITEGATGTFTQFTASAGKRPKVLDPGSTELQTSLMDADAICSAPPVQVKVPSSASHAKQNITCAGDPLSGTLDVRLSFTVPAVANGCTDLGTGGTVACTGCTSIGATVNRTDNTPVSLGSATCSGTSCNITDSAFPVDTTSKSAAYSIVATCVGGGILSSSAVAYTATGLSCGDPPTVSSVKVKGVDIPTDGSFDAGDALTIFEGQSVTITGVVSDPDTALSNVQIVLYYAQEGDSAYTALPAVTPGTDGSFTLTIPSSAVSADHGIVFGFTYSDGDFTESYPATLDTADPTVTALYISNDIISKGTRLDFIVGSEPYPNQMPFRSGGQILILGFEINESAVVTMRIYAPDGTLIRQIENSTAAVRLGSTLATNVCNWKEGCSWDGTTYLGTEHASNGLYIVNIYAVGTGQNFANQTINYTKGIVVMK